MSAFCGTGEWTDYAGRDWFFDYDDGTHTATITGGEVYGGPLIIPKSVEWDGEEYEVTAIGDYAFDAANYPEAEYVEMITIPPSVQKIGVSAFNGCINLVTLNLVEGLETIKASAFENAVRLPRVALPSSVDTIGADAFSGCAALDAVTFTRDAATITVNFLSAFAGTPFLDRLNVNDDLAGAIGIGGTKGTLGACSVLATMETGEPTTVADSTITKTLWWKWTAPSGVSRVSFYTYGSSFDTIMGVYMGGGFPLTKIVENDDRSSSSTSFVSFNVIEGVTYYICVGGWNGACGTVNLAWETTNEPFSLVIVDRSVIGFAGICPASLTIPNSVTNIEESAFDHDEDASVDKLKSVFIPESVVKIGDNAFYECSQLSSVTFENVEVPVDMNVSAAFYNTPYLDSLTGNDNFADAIQLTGRSGGVMGWNDIASREPGEPADTKQHTLWWKWTAPAGVTRAVFHTYGSDFDTVLGVYTGAAVGALTKVAVNDDAIVNWYDKGDTSCVEFDVTAGVEYYICVGGSTLSDSGIVKLGWEACGSGGFSLVTWGDALLGFVGTCPANVSVPDGITLIETSAFDHDYFGTDVDNLKSVVIPESVEIIANYAFYDCSQLASVTFEGDASAIEMDPLGVFYGTPFLDAVNLNDYWADAIELSGAKGSVTAWNAFATDETDEPPETAYHSLWWKWTAPAGVTKAVFHTYGSAFDTVLGVYTGTAVDALADVDINDDRDGVTSLVTFDVTPGETYYICVAGCGDGEGGAVKLSWETAAGFSLVIDNGKVLAFLGECPANLTIPNTVTAIGESAFDSYLAPSAVNLTRVVIPGSVTNIAYEAFNECGNLSSVTFSEGLRTIDEDAFYGCLGLAGQTIILPTTVEYVDEDAFRSVNGELTLMLPRSLNGRLESGPCGTTDLTVGYYVKATLNPNGGTLANRVRMIYGDIYGDLSPLPTRTGYTFAEWRNGGKAVDATTPLPNVATVTLTAQWTVNQYKQTFDANGGTGGKTVTQDFGTALTAPTVTRAGYTFNGWSPAVPATVPAKDAKYTAQWQIVRKTVTLDLGGGTGSGSVTVNYGTKVSSIPVPLRDNYVFVGWFTAPTGGELVPGSTVITDNRKLYARWKADYYLYEDVGDVVPQVASTYDGYLYKNDAAVGTIMVKVGKPNKNTSLATFKATVITAAGKKVLKPAQKKVVVARDGATKVQFTGGEACEVTFGSDGMKGTYGDCVIDGARSVFASKAATDKSVAALALRPWRTVSVAWKGANGWNGLSVTIANKGKAKVSGTLADGTKVSAKGQMIVGEEWCCVPVLVTKKAQLAFMVWLPLEKGGDAQPGALGLGDDAKVGEPGYLKGETPKFHIDAAKFKSMWGKTPLPYLPDGVVVRGSVKWNLPKAGKVVYVRGSTNIDEAKLQDNPAALKLKYKSKDGAFSGSFKAYTTNGGKVKSTKVGVTGVLVNGKGYGTAVIKGVGGVPVTIE